MPGIQIQIPITEMYRNLSQKLYEVHFIVGEQLLNIQSSDT